NKEVINGWAAVKWCLTHQLVQQGYTLLREFMISYIYKSFYFSLEKESEKKKPKETDSRNLFREIRDRLEAKEQLIREHIITDACYAKINEDLSFDPHRTANGDPYLQWIAKQIDQHFISNDFAAIFTAFTQARNDINHAGFKQCYQSSQSLSSTLEGSFRRWTSYLSKNDWKYHTQELILATLEAQETDLALFTCFSHELNQLQREDARNNLGIDKIIEMPQHLCDLWGDIPPDESDIGSHIRPIIQWLSDESRNGHYVLVQGDYGATIQVVHHCWKIGLIPVYATTRRNVEKVTRKNGTIETTRKFVHVQFRKYKHYSQV
ncbi:MAG: CRISPR-associated protein Csx20, partial [Promethearchaeia archaeon]